MGYFHWREKLSASPLWVQRVIRATTAQHKGHEHLGTETGHLEICPQAAVCTSPDTGGNDSGGTVRPVGPCLLPGVHTFEPHF